MAQAEEHVDFVPKPGVTLYCGNAAHTHDPDRPASIPKSLADAWDDYRHKPVPASCGDGGKKKVSAAASTADQGAASAS